MAEVQYIGHQVVGSELHPEYARVELLTAIINLYFISDFIYICDM